MAKRKYGYQETEKGKYADLERVNVNRGYVLEFYHVPTGKIVQFKALLTAYEDKYTSTWKSEDVYGRMDPIANFQKTGRVISLGWDLVSAGIEDAKENLQKATLLFAMLYPGYTEIKQGASIISTAPLFKLAFSNLIRDYSSARETTSNQPGAHAANKNVQVGGKGKTRNTQGQGSVGTSKNSGLVGYVGGFTYSPDLDAGFFDPVGEDAGKLFPQTIKLSCDYTVLHTHPLGWGAGKQFRSKHFPYGQPTIEITPDTGDVMESGKGGTDRQKTAKEEETLKRIK